MQIATRVARGAVRCVALRCAQPRRLLYAGTPILYSRNDRPAESFADPFPLPFSREMDPAQKKHEGVNLASDSQRVGGIDVPVRVAMRENEERPRKLARLQYQCRKRGTLETDLILSTLAQTELPKLSDAELAELDLLLDEPDWDIFYWCTDRKPVPPPWTASFVTQGCLGYRLREHTRNEQRTVRFFPQLNDSIRSPE